MNEKVNPTPIRKEQKFGAHVHQLTCKDGWAACSNGRLSSRDTIRTATSNISNILQSSRRSQNTPDIINMADSVKIKRDPGTVAQTIIFPSIIGLIDQTICLISNELFAFKMATCFRSNWRRKTMMTREAFSSSSSSTPVTASSSSPSRRKTSKAAALDEVR